MANPREEDDGSPYSGSLGPLTSVWKAVYRGSEAKEYIKVPNPVKMRPEDIYGLAVHGLGMSIRPLDTGLTPHVLAVYLPGSNDIFLDWTTTPAAPANADVALRGTARNGVNESVTARLLVAWCCILSRFVKSERPVMLSFETERNVTGNLSPYDYGRAFAQLGHLLAPREHLIRQMRLLGVTVGESEGWRAAVERDAPGSLDDIMVCLGYANRCPTVFIEASLDEGYGGVNLHALSDHLCFEIRYLSIKRRKALMWYQERGEMPLNVEPVRRMTQSQRVAWERQIVLVL